MNTKLFVLVLILIFSVSAYAQFYADVVLDVSESGEVKITGETNYEKLMKNTNELTSKQGSNWTFVLSEHVFDEYVIEIRLPKYATISSMKTNSLTKIDEKNGRLVITVAAIEKSIDVNIKYTIDKTEPIKTFVYWVFGLIILSLLFVFVRRKLSKTSKSRLDRKRFTDRQWEIVSYLQKHGIVTQSELEKELKLPKSSLSRNIETLSKKGIIFKETKGMSNAVGLK